MPTRPNIRLIFIQIIRMKLWHGQKMYLSGCFPQNGTTMTYKFSGNLLLPSMTKYSSNWRHVFQTEGSKVHIYSPDTDIYDIVLPLLLSSIPNKQVMVQLNVPHSPILCSYLHLSKLTNALELDLDIAILPRNSVSKIFQILFICYVCDYISFFHGHGKAAFKNTFFSMHSLLLESVQMVCYPTLVKK